MLMNLFESISIEPKLWFQCKSISETVTMILKISKMATRGARDQNLNI